LSTCGVQSRQNLPHFKERAGKKGSGVGDETGGNEVYRMPHPIWLERDVNSVEITHHEKKTKIDKLAYGCVQTLRVGFDIVSLYKVGKMTENKWLNRIIMLETVAGVPGMIAAMARHFHSLRKLTRDHGWIHTLLEEAENERMHLMTALELKTWNSIQRDYTSCTRCLRKPFLCSLHSQPKVLPQICRISGGRGCQDLYLLFEGN